MVGFSKTDTLSPSQKVIAGLVAGCATRFITQPLDIIKLKLQLAKIHNTTIMNIGGRILKEEGIQAFWSGHVLGQFHSISSVTTQFYCYEVLTKYINNNFTVSHEYKPLISLCCGTFSGCVAVMVSSPLDVVRLRQIVVKDQYKGLIKGVRKVYKAGGVRAFYEGLSAALLQTGPNVGISFCVFSNLQPVVLQHLSVKSHPPEIKKGFFASRRNGNTPAPNKYSAQQVAMASAISGSIAGFVAKTCTYPFDLAKRRLQISTHKFESKYRPSSTSKQLQRCHQLSQCLLLAYRREGVHGLYRGWSITIYKALVTNVVAFTTYEMVCFFLRELQASI